MKKTIAILLAFVCVIACFTAFAGCTAQNRHELKQVLCNHKWKQIRYIAATCTSHYNVITYSCTKCGKEKTERVAATMEELPLLHDWSDPSISRGIDCQHQDMEIKVCFFCRIQQSEPLETYGPHNDNGNGKCSLCGCNLDN